MNLTLGSPSIAQTGSAAGHLELWSGMWGPDFASPLPYEVVFRRAARPSRPRIPTIDMDIRDDLPSIWNRYLDSLARPGGPCDIEHVAAVRAIWSELLRFLGAELRIPRTQPTAEGGVLLAWDLGSEHLELEVFPDRSLHWFYRDRKTNHFEGSNDEPVRSIVVPLRDHLNRVALDR